MKKWKFLPLLLVIALVITLLPPFSFAVVAQADETNEADDDTKGLIYNKTAVYNTESKDFTVSLEAFVTGEMFLSTSPVDIVLVLDQSGSMDFCIECGKDVLSNKQTHSTYEYKAATEISTNQTYYVKDDEFYTAVSYCSGKHTIPFVGVDISCQGGAGWYRANGGSSDHATANKITPKSSENPDGVQFYTRAVNGSAYCQSRRAALKKAATTFVGIVNNKVAGKDGNLDTADDVRHRIAVVGFAGADATYSSFLFSNVTNTELLSISGSNSGSVGKAYYKQDGLSLEKNLSDKDYQDVLQDMATSAGRQMVSNAINVLGANGATRIDLGMDMAKEVFNNNAADGRKRIVVVLTDGSPTDSDGFETGVANKAISISNELKGDTYKATVYGIGLFNGADASLSGTEPSSDLSSSATDAELAQAGNWFMQKLSSNNGTPNNPSYYLSAHTNEALNSIFSQIANQVSGGSDSTLTETTVIKDIISPQFQLSERADAETITINSYAFAGMVGEEYTFAREPNQGKPATATVGEDGSISVSGFNFSDNWCGIDKINGEESNHGNKLVISFKVKPKSSFLGGNDVETNTSAKIYKNAEDAEGDKSIAEFPKPKVNVPIKDVEVTAEDKNVYLLGSLTAEQIKEGATAKCGNVTLTLGAENYGLDAWQTDYVNITVTYKDADGNEVTNLSDLRADTTYTVSVTVSPKIAEPTSTQGTKAQTKSNTATGKINVFKPQLTFKDSDVYYGDTAPTGYSGNKTGEVWKHGETTSTEPGITMTGTAPTLALTYKPGDGAIDTSNKIATKKDIPVDVTVKIGQTDVTDKTTFVHTKCSGETTDPTDGQFWLHVKTCSLTIKKQAATGTTIGNDEYFVFKVKKDGEDYTEVTIKGTDSVTITELPLGSYTVTEDESVAWRYTSTINNGSVALSKDNSSATVTCTNTLKNGKWLNDFQQVVNTYNPQASTD